MYQVTFSYRLLYTSDTILVHVMNKITTFRGRGDNGSDLNPDMILLAVFGHFINISYTVHIILSLFYNERNNQNYCNNI